MRVILGTKQKKPQKESAKQGWQWRGVATKAKAPSPRTLHLHPLGSTKAQLSCSTTDLNKMQQRASEVELSHRGRANPKASLYQLPRSLLAPHSAQKSIADNLGRESVGTKSGQRRSISRHREGFQVLDIPGVASHIVGRSRSIPKNTLGHETDFGTPHTLKVLIPFSHHRTSAPSSILLIPKQKTKPSQKPRLISRHRHRHRPQPKLRRRRRRS